MKRLLYILPILALIIAGCSREPYADGIVQPNPAYVGEDVTFTNLSTHSDYVEWDFGDGDDYSGSNTTHYYIDPGYYDASLRAFGTKGGVNTWSFTMEVIGSELTVVVERLTPDGEPEGIYIEGASVILYPTYEDWLDFTNGSEEGFTNQNGEVTFTGLSYQRYYVDVWEANHDNWGLGAQDVGYIETEMLDGSFLWTFVAYVEYYPDGKKSTARTRDKALKMEQGAKGEKRELKENSFSVPRK